MLITDGPPSVYHDIFKTYNFPHMPVRIFTYLVGKDSSGADEMLWMACKNKGKHSFKGFGAGFPYVVFFRVLHKNS